MCMVVLSLGELRGLGDREKEVGNVERSTSR